MAFAVPVIVAIAAPTVLTIGAAALAVAGFATGNKTLSKIGGLLSLAGGFMAATSALAGEGAAAAAGEGLAGAASEGGAAAVAAADDAAQGAAFLGGGEAAPQSISQAMLSGGDAATAAVAGGADAAQGALPGSVIDTPASAAMAGQGTNLQQAINAGGLDGPLGDSAANFRAGMGQDNALNGQGIISRILNPVTDWFGKQGEMTKASLVKAGADFLAGGFKRDAQGEYVDMQGRRLSAEEAELARRIANANNVGQVKINMAPNPNANIYPDGRYVAPKVGMIRSAMN